MKQATEPQIETVAHASFHSNRILKVPDIDISNTSRNYHPLHPNAKEIRHSLNHPTPGNQKKKKRFPYEIFSAGSIVQRKALAPLPEDSNKDRSKYIALAKRCVLEPSLDFDHSAGQTGFLPNIKIGQNLPDFSKLSRHESHPTIPFHRPTGSITGTIVESTRRSIGGSQFANLELLASSKKLPLGDHLNGGGGTVIQNSIESTQAMIKAGKYKLEPLNSNTGNIRTLTSLDNVFLKTGYFGAKEKLMDVLKSKYETAGNDKAGAPRIEDGKGKAAGGGKDDDSVVNITFGAKCIDNNEQ